MREVLILCAMAIRADARELPREIPVFRKYYSHAKNGVFEIYGKFTTYIGHLNILCHVIHIIKKIYYKIFRRMLFYDSVMWCD